MFAFSTRPSSITSPVRIRRAAFATVAGFIMFTAPRSSPLPHLDGQRALSAGGDQLGAGADHADAPATITAAAINPYPTFFISSLFPKSHRVPLRVRERVLRARVARSG